MSARSETASIFTQYECCTGRYPFEAQNTGALIRKIMRGSYPPISGPYSQQLLRVVAACLTFDPKQRPDARALLALPAVRDKVR